MQLSPTILKAINEACRLHNGQFRKVEQDLPYVSHCVAVGWLVAEAGGSEAAITAAFLHDTLEDVPGYSYEKLVADFGKEVAAIVREVSEDEENGGPRAPWKIRKEKYLKHLEIASREALLVAAADKIHNLRSMTDAYLKYGEAIWKTFHATNNEKLWFYEQVLLILQKRLNNYLVEDLAEVLTKARNILQEKK